MINKNNRIYQEDISSVLQLECDFSKLTNKTVLITGASGLVGTVLVDMFEKLNNEYNLNLKLILVSRHYEEINDLKICKWISHDISEPLILKEKIDYIIHAASNTHPLQYSKYPIETISTNILGSYNLLNLACNNFKCRFLLLSSVEIYGDDSQKLENGFSEEDFGYLNCNSARAGYCESKRLSESLCQAYKAQKDLDFVTARLCRLYGPTLKKDDSKALSQFLYKGLNKENIILKSEGNQFFSYLYVFDAALALIFLLLNGESGNAYNVSDKNSNVKLKDLANCVANLSGTKLEFELPSEIEKEGFSRSQRAILNSSKINSLGWKAKFSLEDGLYRTLEVLKDESL